MKDRTLSETKSAPFFFFFSFTINARSIWREHLLPGCVPTPFLSFFQIRKLGKRNSPPPSGVCVCVQSSGSYYLLVGGELISLIREEKEEVHYVRTFFLLLLFQRGVLGRKCWGHWIPTLVASAPEFLFSIDKCLRVFTRRDNEKEKKKTTTDHAE